MSWFDVLSSLEAIIANQKPDPSWEAGKTLSRKRHEVSENLNKDLAQLAEQAEFIFSPNLNPDLYTRQMSALFQSWHQNEKAPSLCAITIFACQHLGISENDPLAPAMMMAGLLGGVENTLAYHNNMHFKNVLLQTAGLIAAHNEIHEDQPQELQRDHMALLLLSACIHDLGHEGRGNITADGTYLQSRAEKHSFGLAKPYLLEAGLEEVELEDVLILLIATDVIALDGHASPVSQVKEAYRQHFMNGPAARLQSDLHILQKRADLALMGLLLHEADLATSAGLDYTMTAFETALFRQETAKDRAKPSHIVSFMEKICGGTMLSTAAQKIFGASMQAVLQKAREDVALGDEPFPAADDFDFLTGLELPQAQTIN